MIGIKNKTPHKNTATIIILSSVAVILVGVIGFSVFFGIPYLRYQNAVSMMEAGEYEKAIALLEAMPQVETLNVSNGKSYIEDLKTVN